MSIDILLRVHAEESHGTVPLRCVELSWECQGWVWVDRLPIPSRHTVRIGVGPVDGSSPGSATSQLSLPPPLPLPGLLSSVRVGRPRPRPELVVPRGVRHRQTQTSADTDTDSELLCVVFVRWLLFGSHKGHTLVPAWADTQTASFGRSATLGS